MVFTDVLFVQLRSNEHEIDRAIVHKTVSLFTFGNDKDISLVKVLLAQRYFFFQR